jgi:hypothetical protein
MSIKINVKKKEQKQIAELGGQLLEDGKTWVIPDWITDINPFMQWLPQEEGHIVQRPYFAVRAKCRCWKCGGDITVVGLGAKNCQELVYVTADKPQWINDSGPLLFTEIDRMDEEIAASMKANYPFFRYGYSSLERTKAWGNHCIHCQARQEDDGDFMFGVRNPLSPVSVEQAREIRVVYFSLPFDYYVSGTWGVNTLFGEFLL